MSPRHALLAGLLLGLTACGPAPATYEIPAYTPPTYHELPEDTPPAAQRDGWIPSQMGHSVPYSASGGGGTYRPPAYVVVPYPYGYPLRRYYTPYRGPVKLFGVLPIGSQHRHGSGYRRR